MRLLKRKAVVVVMALAMVVGTSATAFAWWSSGGTGGGRASAANPTGTVRVNQTSEVAGLFPGGNAANLEGNFNNPNASPVFVSQVTATIAEIRGGNTEASKPACTASDFALGNNPVSVNASIPSGSAAGYWGPITISLTDNGANQDNCKGATAVISYTTS
jgi:hypothetical protein